MKSIFGSKTQTVSVFAALLLTLFAPDAFGQTNCAPPPSGLVSWWQAESNALDSVGGNNGVFTGAAFAPGEVGSAFSFDASGDNIRVPASASLDLGAGRGLTIEAWINSADNTYGRPIVEWVPNTSGAYSAGFFANFNQSGTLFAYFVSADNNLHSIQSPPGLLLTNVFQHVAVTYDKSSGVGRLFINGAMVQESPLGTFTPQTATDLSIGYRPDTIPFGPIPFIGRIDELGLYSRALSPVELQGIYNAGSAGKCVSPAMSCTPAPAGLVSWWPGEGNVFDAVNGNNATETNGIAFTPGLVGSALNFDGVTSTVVVPASSSLNVSNLTVETWIFPSDVATPRPIFEYADATGPSSLNFWYGIGAGAQPVSGALFGTVRDGTNPGNNFYVTSSGGLLPTNQWSHVSLTFDSATGTAALFLNGVRVATNSVGVPVHPNTHLAVNLGYRPVGSSDIGAGSRHLGKLDEASLYNRALTASEIQAIYNVGRAGKCSGSACVPSPSGLVSWWQAEGSAVDSVSGNNGILHGGVSFAPGKSGNGFSFDGTGYIVIPDNPTLNFSTALTIELWYMSALPNSDYFTIIDKRVGASIANYGINNAPVSGLGVFYDDPTVNDGDDAPFGSFFEVSRYSPAPNPGAFHHLAASYQQLTNSHVQLQTYVDGQLVRTKVIMGNLSNTLNSFPVTIGAAGGGAGEFFKGVIDEVSIYNRALGASEVQAIYSAASGKCNSQVAPSFVEQPLSQEALVGATVSFTSVAAGSLPLSYQWLKDGSIISGAATGTLVITNVQLSDHGSYSVIASNVVGVVTSSIVPLLINGTAPCQTAPSGLVGWWRGEGTGKDFAGNNNGTLVNGTGFAPAEVGSGFSFNGASEFVQIPDSPSLRFTKELTIELWYKDTGAPAGTYYGLIAKRAPYPSGANFGIDMYLGTPSILQVYLQDPNYPGYLTSVSPIPDRGVFHHIAATYRQVASEQVELKTYIDGQLVQTGSVNGNLARTVNDAPVTIGADDINETYFIGIIDEPSIYNRALSASEIQAIYDAHAAGKCGGLIPSMISAQPVSQTAQVGDAVTFAVVAGGSAPLSYQWQFNGAPILNETSSSLVLVNVSQTNAGIYSVVITNLAGSVTSSNAVLTVTLPPASIQVADATAAVSGAVSLPINLLANGNENALGFTLNFDPTLLTYKEAILGSGASGASLLLNQSQAVAGRVGVAAAMPAGITFEAGTRQLVLVRFASAIVTASNTSVAVTFVDSPIPRLLADVAGQPLAANYLPGTVNLPATAFEGDVYPRPNGDETVSISDWVLVGRYVARLDSPTNSAEFQRADCAPRTTLGDGVLTVSDWVQAGRFAAGLDPITRVGGPDSETPAVLAATATSSIARKTESNPRQLKIVSPIVAQGQSGTLEVEMEAQGDENALAFSLSFDPTKLMFSGASLGEASAGAVLNVNLSQSAQGHLGCVLALKANRSFAAGSKQIIKASFQSILSVSGSTAIAFSDQPVPRGISDANASTLAADYINGSLVINPRPSLRISTSVKSISLSWPSSAAGFVLQESDDPGLNATSWKAVDVPPVVTSGENVVLLPANAAQRFYRLYQQ